MEQLEVMCLLWVWFDVQCRWKGLGGGGEGVTGCVLVRSYFFLGLEMPHNFVMVSSLINVYT